MWEQLRKKEEKILLNHLMKKVLQQLLKISQIGLIVMTVMRRQVLSHCHQVLIMRSVLCLNLLIQELMIQGSMIRDWMTPDWMIQGLMTPDCMIQGLDDSRLDDSRINDSRLYDSRID